MAEREKESIGDSDSGLIWQADAQPPAEPIVIDLDGPHWLIGGRPRRRRYRVRARLVTEAWDPADHPREPAGSEQGGEFTAAAGGVDLGGNWKTLEDLPDDASVLLYHATSRDAARDIMANGWDPTKAGAPPKWGNHDSDYVYLGGSPRGLGTYLGPRGGTERGAFVVFSVRKGDLEPDLGGDWKSYLRQPNARADLRRFHGKDALSRPSAVVTYATIGQVRARHGVVKPVRILDGHGDTLKEAEHVLHSPHGEARLDHDAGASVADRGRGAGVLQAIHRARGDAGGDRIAARVYGPGYRGARENLTPVWGWGPWRLLPLFQILPAHLADTRAPRYQVHAWSSLPAMAAGVPRGPWVSATEALRSGGPGDVLLRLRDGKRRAVDVLAESGWVPLAPERPTEGQWIMAPGGRVLDGEDGAHWQPRRRRLGLDLIEAWPGLGRITLRSTGIWRVAAVAGDRAEAVAAGLQTIEAPGGRDLDQLVREALAEAPDPERPYLLLGDPDLAVIVDCLTGGLLYTRESNAPELLAPYERAAVAVFEGEGLVWAVRPTDKAIWVLPGGHIDPGERPVDAAIREAREEAGLVVIGPRFMGRLYTQTSTTHVFAAKRDGDRLAPSTPDEIEAVQLVPLDDLVATDRAFLLRHRRPTEVDLFHQPTKGPGRARSDVMTS